MRHDEFLDLVEHYIPCPLTRDEIIIELSKRGYPTDNAQALDSIMKICRMVEELHGITLKNDKHKAFRSRVIGHA